MESEKFFNTGKENNGGVAERKKEIMSPEEFSAKMQGEISDMMEKTAEVLGKAEKIGLSPEKMECEKQKMMFMIEILCGAAEDLRGITTFNLNMNSRTSMEERAQKLIHSHGIE